MSRPSGAVELASLKKSAGSEAKEGAPVAFCDPGPQGAVFKLEHKRKRGWFFSTYLEVDDILETVDTRFSDPDKFATDKATLRKALITMRQQRVDKSHTDEKAKPILKDKIASTPKEIAYASKTADGYPGMEASTLITSGQATSEEPRLFWLGLIRASAALEKANENKDLARIVNLLLCSTQNTDPTYYRIKRGKDGYEGKTNIVTPKLLRNTIIGIRQRGDTIKYRKNTVELCDHIDLKLT